MKVLMTANTLDEEGSHVPGEVVELRDEIAKKYIENGWAIAHQEPAVERAVAGGAEQATGKAQAARSGTAHPTPPSKPEDKPAEEKAKDK